MNHESAVQFAGNSRIHVGLAVRRLDRAVAFYQALLGRAPTKTRPGYAKFEVAEPAVNLSLIETSGSTGQNNPAAHFGIQVKSTAAVRMVAERLTAAGVALRHEEEVDCCYAVQNKIWALDPDGNAWETYVVLNDDGARRQPLASAGLRTAPQASDAEECCPRGLCDCVPHDLAGTRPLSGERLA